MYKKVSRPNQPRWVELPACPGVSPSEQPCLPCWKEKGIPQTPPDPMADSRSPALEGRLCYTQTLSWEPQGTVPMRMGQGHFLSHGSWAPREPYNLRASTSSPLGFPVLSDGSQSQTQGAWGLELSPFSWSKRKMPWGPVDVSEQVCDWRAFTIGQHFLSPDGDKCW